ncbi:MAG: hypothetical protein ABEJ25_01210 [Candidatus Bipolaricaulia bacterium]
MELSTKEFRDRIEELSGVHFPAANLQTREYSKFRIKLRLVFSVGFFLEVFYAPQTDKVSFTLIDDGKRIFGIDNLGGWHRHPLENPSTHVDISEQKFEKIFEFVKNSIEEKKT